MELLQFFVFFLQQLPLLLSMLTTMWVAVKRCPLFLKGGIVAIIALFLSLFVATTPIVASPALGAIDHIELAHANNGIIPIKPEGRIKERHIPPRLVKSGGQWRTTSSMHWFSDEKPVSLMLPPNLRGDIVVKAVIVAALIAVTIDGATMPPPGGVLDGMAMMSIAPIVKQRGEGSKSALVKLFGPTWSVTGFGSAPYSIFKAVWEATMATPYPDTDSEGNWNIRTEFSHCNDLPCVIDLENLTDRSIHRVDIKGVPYDLLEQIFADTKNGITTIPVITGEVICLFGITPEEIMEVYDLNYSRKLWSKYLGKELPAHRANWAVVDSSTVEVVEALTDPDDDGTLILFGPKEGIDEFLGTPMPRNTTGMGMRVFGETLTKGRCRVVYSDNKDSKRLLDLVPQAKDKVVIVSHPDNNKGTMGRKIDGELLVTWWFYQQRPKAGTSGPQFLAQWAGQWGKTFLHTAMAMVWTSAHGALEAIRYGRLDEGLLVSDERKELLGFALRCRQAFMERLLLLNIPLAVSSNLLMLIKPLIREWKICLRRFKECAQEWNMALPWSCAAIVLSSSARSLMGSVPKGMRNKKLWWCKHFKELILDKSVMEEVKRLAPKTDLGDRDGDMIFCWLVFDITSGKYVVLVSRHPVGVGGFVVLQLDEVSVPWQNIVQKDKNGVEFSLLPLRVELPKTSDQYDWTEVSIDVVDEDEPAFGPIKDWAEISAYEAKKAAACPGLGMAINNMTLKLIHDHDLKPISTELLADFSQSGAGNVKAMKALQEVVKASGSDVREWEYVDRAAVAKYNCKTTDKNGEVVANIVDGSFTKLIESVSAEYRAAHQWLQKNLDTHVSARNSEALLSLTEKAGLSPNTEDAAKALAWCEKYNVLNNKGSVTNPDFVKTLHARIDALEPKEAAETALGLYVLLCEAGRYDALVMWLFNEPTGFQEDCILGYIIAYLEMHTGDDDDPEGPNPEGDGPKGDDGWMLLEMAAEDATNCGTSEEPNDRTDEILFDAYHLPTREQMRSMKQKDLAEYCRINDFITGWSKFNKIALREELIQRIVECVLDDYNNNNDDDDPTPPNGGGDRPTNETNETDKVREWSVEYWHNMADWCGDDLCSASDYLREADKQREFDVEGHVNRKLHVVSMRQEKKIAERLRREGHFAYYIGRQMTIGNEKFPASQLANKFKHGSKEQNIADFKEWFDKNKDGHLKQILSWIVERSMRAMVQGKQVYLVCWCAPEACHGDVVKKYVVEKVAEAILEAEWYGEDQEPFEEFKSEVIYQAKDNELKKGEKVKMVKKKTVPIKRGGEEMKNLPSVGIWTDGACKGNPGRGGWGVVLNSPDNAYHFNFRKTISGGQANATNNRMELMAAIEGLKALKRPSKVSVYSDSQYVVKGITEWVNGWIAKGWKKADGKPVNNVDLWKELVELNKIHDVEWVWVKGHAGSPLNEMADQLANRGCEDFSRKEENYTNQQGSTLLDMVFVVAALLLMSSVAAAFGGMEGFMSMMYNVVVWREAVDGTHPWKRWNDKKRCKMPVLKKQMNGAKKCMHEVREMTLLSEEEKEEMECHYKTQMAFIQEEIEQLLSEEPTDRPLDINYKKSSVYSQKCGSKHVKTTPGKNKDKGYWVTHPNCRPDEPCKRACGGNIFKEDELIIRKGERVTLWYTPVKLSQVESYWGNKVVRKEA